MPILNDFSSASQEFSSAESIHESASKANRARLTPSLQNRDEMDLILLNYAGKQNGVEIKDLLPKVAVTTGTLSTRMVRMTELGFLRRIKRTDGIRGPRPPYVYFLGPGVTLEAIEEEISRQGIDVKQFELQQIKQRARQANKRNETEVVPGTDNTLEEDFWQSTQSHNEVTQNEPHPDITQSYFDSLEYGDKKMGEPLTTQARFEKVFLSSDQEERNGKAYRDWDTQKLQQTQLEQEQEDTNVLRVNHCATSDSTPEVNTAEPPLHVTPDELSRLVTVGEVLEMFEEATDTLIETISENLVELFNEKVVELNARIAELEQRYLPHTSRSKEEPTEGLVLRSRLLMRQKILDKLPSQNGNGKA